MATVDDPKQQIQQFRADYDELFGQIQKGVIGQKELIETTLIALFAGGHVLLEGVPGLGKTLLAKTLAQVLELKFRRIQFTPDLMPADVIGTYVVLEAHGRRRFEFQEGPIFANLLLADEINRATPKTQSALLEALDEGACTVANETYPLPRPFFAVATQSPSDEDGTFPLPATQLDRFLFKLNVPFPSATDLEAILDRATAASKPELAKVLKGERILEMTRLARRVPVAPEVRRMAVNTVLATHPENPLAPPAVRRFVAAGSSPRGAQAMILAGKIRALLEGRLNVSQQDLAWAALPALRHRLSLNFEGHAERVKPDDIVREVLQSAGKSPV